MAQTPAGNYSFHTWCKCQISFFKGYRSNFLMIWKLLRFFHLEMQPFSALLQAEISTIVWIWYVSCWSGKVQRGKKQLSILNSRSIAQTEIGHARWDKIQNKFTLSTYYHRNLTAWRYWSISPFSTFAMDEGGECTDTGQMQKWKHFRRQSLYSQNESQKKYKV